MARIKLELPENYLFKCEIPVRITDINYGGHLGNDAMLSIIHEARLQFLNHFNFTELDVGGCSIIMADVAIVYKAEVFYGMKLLVEIAVTDIAGRSCDVVYKLSDSSTHKEVARAKTGIVFFDYQARKTCEMPEGFKKIVV